MVRPQVARARRLRHDGTDVEKRLWYRLRSRQVEGAKFRRQQPIGPFFVDFCCVEAKLVIELDGASTPSDGQTTRDAASS